MMDITKSMTAMHEALRYNMCDKDDLLGPAVKNDVVKKKPSSKKSRRTVQEMTETLCSLSDIDERTEIDLLAAAEQDLGPHFFGEDEQDDFVQ